MTSTEIAPRSPATLARLAAVNAKVTEMLTAIPTAEDDGGASIYEQLLAATELKQLNNPWNGGGLEDYRDVRLIVDDLRKLESDYADGPGWYLLVHGAVQATGEEFTVTTSSLAIMIQFVQIQAKGWLPALIIPRVSERKTKSGYEAWRLEVLPIDTPAPGQRIREANERIAAKRAAAAAAPDEPGF